MSAVTPNQVQDSKTAENKQNDKEMNFRQLESKYERALQAERAERERLQAELQKRTQAPQQDEDDGDDEPYVDKKRLDKKLFSFEKRMEEKIEKKAEEKARSMIQKEKQDSWLKSNPDFYDIMQHAEKFAETDPELAETILKMPEGFDRQKLVYSNIKALGLHKPAQRESTIQEKVDANRKSPYYQPSGIAASPYNQGGDFSDAGQKNAYSKMKELQKRLRI